MQTRTSPTMSTSLILFITILSFFTLVDAHSSSNLNSQSHKLRMERRAKSSKLASAISTVHVISQGKVARVALAPPAGSFKSSSKKSSSNGQCTVTVSAKTNKAIKAVVQNTDQNCADAAAAVVKNGTDGLLGCYKIGFVDTEKGQFGAELSVWNVGSKLSTQDLSDTSLQLSWANANETFETAPGSFVASSNTSASLAKIASFHVVSKLPSTFNSSTDLSSLTPKLSSSGVTPLGLIDVTGLNSTSLRTAAWGLYNKEFTPVKESSLRKLSRFVKRAFIDLTNGAATNASSSSSSVKEESTSSSAVIVESSTSVVSAKKAKSTNFIDLNGSDDSKVVSSASDATSTSTSSKSKATATSTSSASSASATKSSKNNSGTKSDSSQVIVADGDCTIIITDNGIIISDGIVISGGSSLTISNGIVITDAGTTTTTTTTSKASKTTTKSTKTSTSTVDSTTSTSVADTTTTADSSTETGGIGASVVGFGSSIDATATATATTTDAAASATETGGIGVNVQGFVTSVASEDISSVLESAASASTTTVDVNGVAASADSSASATVQGALATSLADTTTEATASSTPFQLPGRQLQVLPIGLGVFAGVSVLALGIVGIVTYERRKYRRQFRLRREQEQAGARGMTEIKF